MAWNTTGSGVGVEVGAGVGVAVGAGVGVAVGNGVGVGVGAGDGVGAEVGTGSGLGSGLGTGTCVAAMVSMAVGTVVVGPGVGAVSSKLPQAHADAVTKRTAAKPHACALLVSLIDNLAPACTPTAAPPRLLHRLR